MRPPLKLSAIDQEHLQELYDAAGVARDELPYTPVFEQIWQGFQDRTFKNAARDQLFAALLKYTRSSTNSPTGPAEAPVLTDDQKKLLKPTVARHSVGGKLLPYSDEFDAALKDFNAQARATLSDAEFWKAIIASQGAKRRPPPRRASRVAAPAVEEDDVE